MPHTIEEKRKKNYRLNCQQNFCPFTVLGIAFNGFSVRKKKQKHALDLSIHLCVCVRVFRSARANLVLNIVRRKLHGVGRYPKVKVMRNMAWIFNWEIKLRLEKLYLLCEFVFDAIMKELLPSVILTDCFRILGIRLNFDANVPVFTQYCSRPSHSYLWKFSSHCFWTWHQTFLCVIFKR